STTTISITRRELRFVYEKHWAKSSIHPQRHWTCSSAQRKRPTLNAEHPTSNCAEPMLRVDAYALSFDVGRWTFGVFCQVDTVENTGRTNEISLSMNRVCPRLERFSAN